jgi:hypothetical protein
VFDLGVLVDHLIISESGVLLVISEYGDHRGHVYVATGRQPRLHQFEFHLSNLTKLIIDSYDCGDYDVPDGRKIMEFDLCEPDSLDNIKQFMREFYKNMNRNYS